MKVRLHLQQHDNEEKQTETSHGTGMHFLSAFEIELQKQTVLRCTASPSLPHTVLLFLFPK